MPIVSVDAHQIIRAGQAVPDQTGSLLLASTPGHARSGIEQSQVCRTCPEPALPHLAFKNQAEHRYTAIAVRPVACRLVENGFLRVRGCVGFSAPNPSDVIGCCPRSLGSSPHTQGAGDKFSHPTVQEPSDGKPGACCRGASCHPAAIMAVAYSSPPLPGR
jgi:hypothetical protein